MPVVLPRPAGPAPDHPIPSGRPGAGPARTGRPARAAGPALATAQPGVLAQAVPAEGEAGVIVGPEAEVLRRGWVEGWDLAVWTRARPAAVAGWLDACAPEALPRMDRVLHVAEAAWALDAALAAAGAAPDAPGPQAWRAEVLNLVHLAGRLARDRVRLRLEVIGDDRCRRWHRDAVPWRLLATQRGEGTDWMPPRLAAEALARPDEDHPGARRLRAGDVALLRGGGRAGDPPGQGLVHRSPRGSQPAWPRLLLGLEPAPPA